MVLPSLADRPTDPPPPAHRPVSRANWPQVGRTAHSMRILVLTGPYGTVDAHLGMLGKKGVVSNMIAKEGTTYLQRMR